MMLRLLVQMIMRTDNALTRCRLVMAVVLSERVDRMELLVLFSGHIHETCAGTEAIIDGRGIVLMMMMLVLLVLLLIMLIVLISDSLQCLRDDSGRCARSRRIVQMALMCVRH